ncbi:MAG TPA: hypothetical protein PK639_03710 [Candidatus Woesebacteria bacterium]|nr:hypothetical protein [Candidatus Woesebacteria bacterium]
MIPSIFLLLAFLWSISPLNYYTVQLIAFLAIIFIFLIKNSTISRYLLITLTGLIIFSSHGLASPFFFLSYFLIFYLSFIYSPLSSFLFSLAFTLLLSNTLSSFYSFFTLFSLFLITPLVWFVSHNYHTLAVEETDFLLWSSLKFKTGISVIIDLTSQLLSTPLTPTQSDQVKKIKQSAKSLLNSSQKLTHDH